MRVLRAPGIVPAFARDRDGGLAVEFAFVSIILIVIMGGIVDVMAMSSISRDIERSSTRIGEVLISCSRSLDSKCQINTLQALIDRPRNVLVRVTEASMSIAQVAKVGGAFRVCSGNMTFVASDVAASAGKVLAEGDTAIIVLLTGTYRPLLPIGRLYGGSATKQFRNWTTSIQASNSPAC